MLHVFQYEIGDDVLTLEAFRGGGTTVSGADLWPQTGLHDGSVVLEGWVVVNLSLEMLGFHIHLLQKLEICRKGCLFLEESQISKNPFRVLSK